MSLYFWVNVLSISVPLAASFHTRIQFYKNWGPLFISIALVMVPYIVWDEYFTSHGYWGFSEPYLSGLYVLSLPVEEWLFFVTIPYSCVFTHYSIMELGPSLMVSDRWFKRLSMLIATIFVMVLILNYSKAYTAVDMIFGLVALGLAYFTNPRLLKRYYISFLFMLVPFFIVNGVLTGAGIENQIVWYNDAQNLGIRLYTIPIEDTVYAFSLILFNLLVFEAIVKKVTLTSSQV